MWKPFWIDSIKVTFWVLPYVGKKKKVEVWKKKPWHHTCAHATPGNGARIGDASFWIETASVFLWLLKKTLVIENNGKIECLEVVCSNFWSF